MIKHYLGHNMQWRASNGLHMTLYILHTTLAYTQHKRVYYSKTEIPTSDMSLCKSTKMKQHHINNSAKPTFDPLPHKSIFGCHF